MGHGVGGVWGAPGAGQTPKPPLYSNQITSVTSPPSMAFTTRRGNDSATRERLAGCQHGNVCLVLYHGRRWLSVVTRRPRWNAPMGWARLPYLAAVKDWSECPPAPARRRTCQGQRGGRTKVTAGSNDSPAKRGRFLLLIRCPPCPRRSRHYFFIRRGGSDMGDNWEDFLSHIPYPPSSTCIPYR